MEFTVKPEKLGNAIQDGFNPIQLEPQPQPEEEKGFWGQAQEMAEGALSGAARGLTLGHADKLYELTTGQPAERYQQHERKTVTAAPKSAFAGEIAGSMLPASKIAKGAKILMPAKGVLPTITRVGLEGAAMGGL